MSRSQPPGRSGRLRPDWNLAGLSRLLGSAGEQPEEPLPDEIRDDSDTDIGTDTVGGGNSSPELTEHTATPDESVPVSAERTALPESPRIRTQRRRAKMGVPGWLAAGGSAAAILMLCILLFSLLGEPAAPPERPPAPTLPSAFQTSLPPALSGPAGVRPMDTADEVRRREGMASFAAMGQAEEAELRAEESGDPPSDNSAGNRHE